MSAHEVSKIRKSRACLVSTQLREMEIIGVKGVVPPSVPAALRVWAASKVVGWRWELGAFGLLCDLE